MAKPKTAQPAENAKRVTRAHFLLIASYMLTTVAFNSWNLIARDLAGKRWLLAGILLAVNALLWYLAHTRQRKQLVYQLIIAVLVLGDLIFATLNVYWERGMAATSVIFFSVAIATAGALLSRTALVTTATLALAGYSTAAVLYFYNFYGEGYQIQLWGQVLQYGLVFYVLAWLMLIVVEAKKS